MKTHCPICNQHLNSYRVCLDCKNNSEVWKLFKELGEKYNTGGGYPSKKVADAYYDELGVDIHNLLSN